ncbi:hypothetical protein BCR35DRAFT_154178 [Leucosporidium creatinivorum]|uniref:Uncharacterized protein n=1 Tax=Leucosporidium creatinivorum TaxID=106004 RepID=A0A1Y2FZJ9_9BASI|nr:hypothetical protein BCR35DRAFT_154178 [Leucosporidium creatinivorum]
MGGGEGIQVVSSFAFDDPAFATPRERLVTAVNFLPSPPSLTSNATLLLLGTSLGSLILASLPATSTAPPQAIATARKVLAEGVLDVATLSDWSETDDGWSCEVESVGRDGVRAVVRVSCSAEGDEWTMKVVGQQKVSKGLLDQILPSPPSSSQSPAALRPRRYLSLQDANAVVFDESGTKLLSFLSPGTSVPRAFVEDATGIHYYRIVHGKIHHQLAPLPSTTLPPSSLLPSLHGREIRCVALHRAQVAGREVTIVATGAENAVLKISLLHPSSHALLPLFTDSSIPSALKSICWSISPSGLFLFASGAGEMLLVSRVNISSAPESEASVRVNVRPWAQAKAITGAEEEKEKGQVRVMDMAVCPLPVDAEGGERHLALTGWSDGKLRVRQPFRFLTFSLRQKRAQADLVAHHSSTSSTLSLARSTLPPSRAIMESVF